MMAVQAALAGDPGWGAGAVCREQRCLKGTLVQRAADRREVQPEMTGHPCG